MDNVTYLASLVFLLHPGNFHELLEAGSLGFVVGAFREKEREGISRDLLEFGNREIQSSDVWMLPVVGLDDEPQNMGTKGNAL